MACTCQYGGLCAAHPKCPKCQNYSTVFASGAKEFRCTRCRIVFDRRAYEHRYCTTLDHIYPEAAPGQIVLTCYCGKSRQGVTTMAKKNIVAKKSVAKKSAPVTERASNMSYRFLRSPEKEPGENTIDACVLTGIKKLHSGSLDEAVKAAVAAGFTKLTERDPKPLVRMALRKFANEGVVKATRNGEETAAPKKVAAAKGKGKDKPKGKKKGFKLVKGA